MYRLAIILAALAIGPTAAISQIRTCDHHECDASVKNEHNHGNYRFFTTSQVYKKGDDFIYETCVQNIGKNDLEINWIIPGPNSVVPKGCAIKAKRPFPSKETIGNYSACLRYGANWEWKRAPFHPHRDDAPAISNESDNDCRKFHKAQNVGGKSSVRHISFLAQRFGSSDNNNFAKTLSKMDFVVTVTPKPGRGVFSTSIDTIFSPAYLNHPDYYSKGFTIRPSETAIQQKVFVDAKGNFSGTHILEKGTVKYEMKIPENPIQRFVRYDVLSAQGKAVASIDVPIWVSGKLMR